jgi:ADP-ribose pyrophosphatase YjhB (NUDIX family)
VLRKAHEETGYTVEITGFVGVYSLLKRDPRFPAIAITYKGRIVEGISRRSSEGMTCWRTPDEVLGIWGLTMKTC